MYFICTNFNVYIRYQNKMAVDRWEIIQNWCLYSIASLIYSSWFNHSSKTMFFDQNEASAAMIEPLTWDISFLFGPNTCTEHLVWLPCSAQTPRGNDITRSWHHEVTGRSSPNVSKHGTRVCSLIPSCFSSVMLRASIMWDLWAIGDVSYRWCEL